MPISRSFLRLHVCVFAESGLKRLATFRAASIPRRKFHRWYSTEMAGLSVQLKAPNGRTYTQPIGLFINNEFVASKSGAKLASINPTLVIRVTS